MTMLSDEQIIDYELSLNYNLERIENILALFNLEIDYSIDLIENSDAKRLFINAKRLYQQINDLLNLDIDAIELNVIPFINLLTCKFINYSIRTYIKIYRNMDYIIETPNFRNLITCKTNNSYLIRKYNLPFKQPY